MKTEMQIHFLISSEMEELWGNYSEWLKHSSDQRVAEWFLMSSPLPAIAICFSFLLTAKLLHIWMRNRAPINIKLGIWCFDVFHLTASVTLIVIALRWRLLENFNCR